ncbi:ABC transporter permease [Micromonospora sp. NPDC050417]|uniref:ABC transporter permease n=1 Tax=Micromonospora sp. NPDC050417 TaxID=3364280 RepID=UPI0037BC751C
MTTFATAVPPGRAAALGNGHLVLLRNLMVHRHSWTILAFGVVEPILYLVSIGAGVGQMIGHVDGLGDTVTFPQYIAPALLAVAAMNGAMNATTQGVFTRLRYEQTYHAMLTTPITARGIALGEAAWAVLRGTIEAAGFLGIMLVCGLIRSPWAVLALPGAVLIAFAFACAGLLVATLMRDWPDNQIVQLVMLPMFLFATTFYPLTVYPQPIQYLINALPLYHSIQIIREPVLGTIGADLTGSAAYLVVMGAICLWAGTRRLERQLAR